MKRQTRYDEMKSLLVELHEENLKLRAVNKEIKTINWWLTAYMFILLLVVFISAEFR